MKKWFVCWLGLVLIGLACGSREAGTKLEEGTELYELSKTLANVVPELDPDENKVLVTTKYFVLTTGDVMQELRSNVGNRIQQLQSLDAQRLKETLRGSAEDLAEKKLLLRKAEEAGITLTQAELDSAMNLQYARVGGQPRYVEMLKAAGVTLEHVQQEVRNGLIIQRFLEQVLADELEVNDAEIEAAYKEDKTATVRHILLSTQGKSDAEKAEIRRKMEGILERARAGEDFAALAKEYTDDPGSKENGGLYEDFGRGRMVKPFEDAAFSVPVGEISDIVETRFGYHILKIVERKKETRPLDEVRDEIRQTLERKKYRDAYQAYLERLKAEAEFSLASL